MNKIEAQKLAKELGKGWKVIKDKDGWCYLKFKDILHLSKGVREVDKFICSYGSLLGFHFSSWNSHSTARAAIQEAIENCAEQIDKHSQIFLEASKAL